MEKDNIEKDRGAVGRNHLVFRQENHLGEIIENASTSDIELSDCVSSGVSDNSDWSDEERENLEKIFGAMSERGEE